MTVNLLSVSAMAKKCIRTVAEGNSIVLSREGKIVAKAKLVGSTYLLKAVAPETALGQETREGATQEKELVIATTSQEPDATCSTGDLVIEVCQLSRRQSEQGRSRGLTVS